MPSQVRPPVRAHLGVIDVGSNAIRLQVARVHADGSFSVVYDERDPVRLGEDVFRTGKLAETAVDRAMNTLRRFASTARQFGVRRIRSVATSAVRDAANGPNFMKHVEKSLGLKLEIISGSQEANLIARAVLPSVGTREEPVALVDIGGGSTEISVIVAGAVSFSTSVQLGSARLTELFCKSDPLSAEDEALLRGHVREELGRRVDKSRLAACATLVGSAGTFGAIGNFIRKRPSVSRTEADLRSTFSVAELSSAADELRVMDLATRRRTPGIEDRRSETIVAGAILLEEICGYLGAKSVEVVRRGLRDGLMLEEVERLGEPPVRLADSPRRPRRGKRRRIKRPVPPSTNQ